MYKSKLAAALLGALSAQPLMLAAADTAVPYTALEISPLEVPSGIDLPGDFQAALTQSLVEQMETTHKFAQVFVRGRKPDGAPEAPLRLTGSITDYKKGSRAVRYLAGPAALAGPGKTSLKAHVQFIDTASGAVKFETDVDGKVAMGLMGGDSKGAARGLAKEVAKNAKSGL